MTPEERIGQPAPRPANSAITWANRWDHWLARWAIRRNDHRVEPGLYALGSPNADAPVLVTANYTLSFDALRGALPGFDAYVLVLDTKGINVWCAAGKGSFGTDELVRRIEAAGLSQIVNHRRLILPQLGAPGVAAHEVKQRSGFKVEYGPVRAADLPKYLRAREATPEMRRVRFTTENRLELIPVEVVLALPLLLIAAVVSFFLGGSLAAVAAVSAILAATVLFPVAMPWIPTHDFTTKGFILGLLVALPFALASISDPSQLMGVLRAVAFLLALPAVTAFLALNFTGATTFTSRTGVRREIYTYIPIVAVTFSIGMLFALAIPAMRILGGS